GLVQGEGTLGPTVNLQGQRIQGTFPRILHLWSKRENGALPDEQGESVQWSWDRQGARSRVNRVGPEVYPAPGRQVDCTLRGSFVHYRRDQDLAAEQVLVAQVEHAGIRRKLQHQRPHEGHPSGAGLISQGVNVGQQPITQLEVFAANRFDLRPKLPGLTQLGLIPMGPVERAKGAKLEPADVQLRGTFPGKPKAANVGAPQWNTGQANIEPHSHLLAQGSEGHVHIPGPQPGTIALRARKRGAAEDEDALLRSIVVMGREDRLVHRERG